MHIMTKYSKECISTAVLYPDSTLNRLQAACVWLTSTRWLYLLETAKCRGPISALLRMLGSAPRSNSNSQLCCWSFSTAQCRGVLPCSSCTFSSTKQKKKNLNICNGC